MRHSEARATYSHESGTLYSVGKSGATTEGLDAWGVIDHMTPPRLVMGDRPVQLGLDEANTRQVIGPAVAVGVSIPTEVASFVRAIVDSAATKKRNASFAYWDERYQCLRGLKRDGLRFHVEEIPPESCTDSGTYPLLGDAYRRVLDALLVGAPSSSWEIVLDDYGVKGTPLAGELDALAARGAATVAEHHADDAYLAARAASVIARRERVRLIHELRQDPTWQMGLVPVPVGTAGSPGAKAWLDAWEASGQPWPWFVKESTRRARAASKVGA
jgi:ribonuclease HII